MDEISKLKEALDLIKWTLVDACEMNPEMEKEILEAWSLIVSQLKESE
jgi:hypothetical protein